MIASAEALDAIPARAQPYEVHYRIVGHGGQGHTLGIGSASNGQAPVAVETAADGPWVGSGLFSYVSAPGTCVGGPGSPLDILPDEGRCVRVMDDLTDSMAGSEGALCRFTTPNAGLLQMRLQLHAVDPEQQITYEAETQEAFVVVAVY